MENAIQIFKSPIFGEIRTAGTPERPLFCLADLCRVLELQVTPTKNRLNPRGVNSIKVGVQTGIKKDGSPAIQEVDMTFVTEGNMYRVIMRSDKPQAEPFQDWVCEEVLPTLRRTGSYSLLPKVPQTFAEALRLAADQQEEIEEQKLKLEQQAPKVAFANAIEASKSSCLVGELAKIITQNGYAIGQNRLFEWMRNNGYLGTKGEYYNVPNQKYVEQGLFDLKKGVRSGSDGVLHTTITTKVTGKGQCYFINKFLE